VDLNELNTPGGGTAFDFSEIGAEFEAELVSIGEWREITGKFGVKVKAPFNLIIDGEPRTLWVPKGSRMASVIGNAFRDAGLERADCGGRLKMRRIADVPTDKGNPMHDFAARYTPAAKAAAVNLADF